MDGLTDSHTHRLLQSRAHHGKVERQAGSDMCNWNTENHTTFNMMNGAKYTINKAEHKPVIPWTWHGEYIEIEIYTRRMLESLSYYHPNVLWRYACESECRTKASGGVIVYKSEGCFEMEIYRSSNEGETPTRRDASSGYCDTSLRRRYHSIVASCWMHKMSPNMRLDAGLE